MADEGWSPADVDLTTPNTARIYDYLLGGKDNYAADREVAEQLIEVIPEARMAARENHAFIGRAVRFLAREGVRQFIDIGSKLPARGNVHEVAAEVAPDATVVFADGDPVVLAHARALLAGTPHTAAVRCDPRRPDAVTTYPDVRAHIDFERPVACVLDRVLHFIDDDAEAAAAVRRLHDALPPGSHLVFTHITQDPEPDSGGDVGNVFKPTSGHFWGRSRADLLGIAGCFDLLEPGLVYT
ncbi:SAM-dependent methyltransferase, partial [Actinomadura sp. 7K507]|uniref:SAM-dependent methyltransferase n=1 Tax=Actinomadura sp. 7K507 TaxID=2530365 RepID=UPI00104A1185